jgi:acetylornithine deacetylase/succinyl-diaminopimelate desuccinylase-like protein
MEKRMSPSQASLETLRESVKDCQDILLANLVMMAETPAPTFGEEGRVRFLLDRFREAGLDHICDDEVNNGVGLLPGPDGAPTVAVIAHLDTVFGPEQSHATSLGPHRVKGLGIADNSLGAAVLASLPHLLQRLGIEPQVHLLLAGVSGSLGRGNLGGIRFLLENSQRKIDQALCLEGAPLGRLNFTSLAMIRGEIRVEMPDEYDFSRFGVTGAIVHMNDIMNRMLEIPRPSRPQTSVVFGSIQGGNTFHELARKAWLRFEVRSESDDVADMIESRISDILLEVRARSGVEIALDKIAFRRQGGITFDHPLVRASRDVMQGLGIEPKIGPSMSELAALIAHGIPAVTLGLSNGHEMNTTEEEVEIDPVFTGVTQVLGVLQSLTSSGEPT